MQIKIGQREGDYRPVRVLSDAAITNLDEAEDAFDRVEGMLDARAHAGLGSV